ncbi:MAG: cytochrome c biogenesis protein [Deltaproteobacteria bacterium]
MPSLLLEGSLLAYLIGTVAGGLALWRSSSGFRQTTAAALIVGVVLQGSSILARSAASGTIVVHSFTEQVSFFTCLLVAVHLLAQLRFRLAVLAAVVGPLGFIGALVALVAQGATSDVPEFLKSPWLPVHVTLAFLGNAAFALSCLVSFAYLWQERRLKARTISPFLTSLPSLESLDRINFTFLAWGFVLLTLSILSGAVWAELSFGRFLSWEPRTIWSAIVWVIYAALLHARVTIGWGGRRAATLTIVGFGVLFISFVGINMLTPGQHAVAYG